MSQEDRTVESLLCNVRKGLELYERLTPEQKRYGVAAATTVNVALAVAMGLISESVKGDKDLAEELDTLDVSESWGLVLLLAHSSIVEGVSDNEDINDMLSVGVEIMSAHLGLQDGEGTK